MRRGEGDLDVWFGELMKCTFGDLLCFAECVNDDEFSEGRIFMLCGVMLRSALQC